MNRPSKLTSGEDRDHIRQIAEALLRLANGEQGQQFRETDPNGPQTVRSIRPALPDPRLVRTIIRNRSKRANFFDGQLFGEPAWDMLLDLAAARAEHARVSVTSLCLASGVPPTTALRWITMMVKSRLFIRTEDPTDRRRAFIELSDQASDAMARYFDATGNGIHR